MKKLALLFFVTLYSFTSFAQNFEGKIVYKNSYQSKISGLSDQMLSTMMGTTQEYFIKEGSYKSLSNGAMMAWQLYLPKDNKIYTKMNEPEMLIWDDGAENLDVILDSKINKAVVVILGYTCDELILTCKSGIQKYYFSTQIPANKDFFKSHAYGNWYAFVSASGSLPLKTIIENSQFTIESEATEVLALKLDNKEFALPAGSKAEKNPYS